MRGKGEVIKKLQEAGYVTRDEAAKHCGRVAGGSTHKLFLSCGVQCVPLQAGTKITWMYCKDDLGNVPPAKVCKPRECAKAASGSVVVAEPQPTSLAHKDFEEWVCEVERRLGILESRKIQQMLVRD